MAKDDHWFKFFYKLFLISTQGWKDDEVGAYLRLLINQFDRGGLPDDEKELAKLITTFKKNWPFLKSKFEKDPDGFLRNRFMDEIRIERDERAKKNSSIGKLGGRPKKNRTETERKPNGFENKSHIYSSSSSFSTSFEEGTGESFEPVGIVPGMIKAFVSANPDYFVDANSDYPACLEIAKRISKQLGQNGPVTSENNSHGILTRWGELVKHIRADSHLSRYSITQILKYFQSVNQSYSNNGTHQQSPGKANGKYTVRKSEGAQQLADSLREFVKAQGS